MRLAQRATLACAALLLLSGTAAGAKRSIRPLKGDVRVTSSRPQGKKDHQVAQIERTFQLPPDAKQGPEDWYSLDLDLELLAPRTDRDRLIYVTGSTNGRASVQIKVKVPQRGSARPTEWSAFGLIDGLTRGASSANRFEISARNYLQFKGVRPGENRLEIGIEQYGELAQDRVRIFKSSRITGGMPGPARVSVRANTLSITIRDDRVTVPVTVTNRGGRAAQHVRVVPEVDPTVLEPVGPQGTLRLEPGETAVRRLVMRAKRSDGKTVVHIRAASDLATDVDVISLALPASSDESSSLSLRVILTAAVFIPAGLVLMRRRRVRRQPTR